MNDVNPKGYNLPETLTNNLLDLIDRLNALELHCPYEFVVTSGYRTDEEQERVNPKVKHSRHCLGQACDVFDADGHLWDWVQDNLGLLEKYGLWIENPVTDPGHLHFQSCPPRSGNRVFFA